jgi:hypothetical protein
LINRVVGVCKRRLAGDGLGGEPTL